MKWGLKILESFGSWACWSPGSQQPSWISPPPSLSVKMPTSPVCALTRTLQLWEWGALSNINVSCNEFSCTVMVHEISVRTLCALSWFVIPKSKSWMCPSISSTFPGDQWTFLWDSWLGLGLACQVEANLVSPGPFFNPSERNWPG